MNIFLDFDNTLVDSNNIVIKYINNKYNINNNKNNLKDYYYKSLYRNITNKEIEYIYESDFFWNSAGEELFTDALKIFEGNNINICSCGTRLNLEKKSHFLDCLGLNYRKAYILSSDGLRNNMKSIYDMHGAIQIDDIPECLYDTNASLKILFTNGEDNHWQKLRPNCDIYVANSWNEIFEIIRWFKNAD